MKEVESQRRRGEEMDAMLTERDRKLAEKEAYIVHLQTALAGDTLAPPQVGGGNIYLRTAETTPDRHSLIKSLHCDCRQRRRAALCRSCSCWCRV